MPYSVNWKGKRDEISSLGSHGGMCRDDLPKLGLTGGHSLDRGLLWLDAALFL